VLATRSAANTGIADADWDSALQDAGGHFLQSTAWQRVQQALSYTVVWARGDGWMWTGPIRSGRFPRYLYVPYGPAALAGHEDDAVLSAAGAARTHSLDFVRLEPLNAAAATACERAGAIAARPIQPRYTATLDLSPDEAELRAGLSAGHRGSINAAARRGLTFSAHRDPAAIDIFIGLDRGNARRGGFHGQSARYHRAVADVLMPMGAARLYTADAEGSTVAAALCFDFAGTRHYAHAVSDMDRGRRLGAAAPLAWQMILDARSAGMRTFDFWGVAPPGGQAHAWAGFTQFKLAFGARVVERGGAWELPVRQMRHRAFRLLQTLRR